MHFQLKNIFKKYFISQYQTRTNVIGLSKWEIEPIDRHTFEFEANFTFQIAMLLVGLVDMLNGIGMLCFINLKTSLEFIALIFQLLAPFILLRMKFFDTFWKLRTWAKSKWS